MLLFLASLLPFLTGSNAATFTLQNRCKQTIWPGIQSGAGQLCESMAVCSSNQTKRPTWWHPLGGQAASGHAAAASSTNQASRGTAPRATVVAASWNATSPEDFYDVSLVDAFNMPVSIVPSGGSGHCSAVKCSSNFNLQCLEKLRVKRGGGVGDTVACKSACLAFNQPQFCCTGAYNNPQVCKPTNYSEVFKKACPTAYSYPYDDMMPVVFSPARGLIIPSYSAERL